MYGADQDTHADTADVCAGRVLPFAKYEFREDQFCCNGTSDRKQYGQIAFKHTKCKMPREQYDRDKNRRYIPEWTPTLVIVLLAIGFPVIIIFSWIYDVHPEGGIIKTEHADKSIAEELPGSSNGWRIASYISFVVIVGLIVLNIVPRIGKKEIIDKSIAVLPFINDSPGSENAYNIDGYRVAVHNKLCQIKGLRVLSLQSTQKFKNQTKTSSEIAMELHVGYTLSATGQKVNNIIQLTVQLVDAHDVTIWSHAYIMPIKSVEDQIYIQSNIAQRVASKLQTTITREEIKRIETPPTTDLTAYEFYQRGNEAYWRYWADKNDKEALGKAKYYFNQALKYDSTLAQAYTGLARIYWGSEGYFSENYLDTVQVLLDMALSFDQGLAEAHTLYGRYFNEFNDTKRAMREVDEAIALNPNDWEAYSIKADISSGYIDRISNCQEAVLLNRGPERPSLLANLGDSYLEIGFSDSAAHIYEEVLELTGDSAGYYTRLGSIEGSNGNFTAANAQYENAFAQDTTDGHAAYRLFGSYAVLGEKEQALKYGNIWVDWMNETDTLWVGYVHRMGYFYWLKGLNEKADSCFNLQIEYCLKEIELERSRAERNLYTYYDLAATYAFIGEKEKALEYLRTYSSGLVMNTTMMFFLKFDPLLNPIRDNPEFQQIVRDVEAKYQAEHERVRQWLEENDML
jgi:TolB-like protein